ncbi:hypothetical protein Tco_0586680 [Tanacetum coccineum]
MLKSFCLLGYFVVASAFPCHQDGCADHVEVELHKCYFSALLWEQIVSLLYFCNSVDTTEGRMKDTESSTFHVVTLKILNIDVVIPILANALIVRSCQTLLCGLLRISPSNGVVTTGNF